ncbi:MAG: universal stress protein [Phycisphaerae bacterium]|nr:universal stress protein [Saprospiraceae bacterium]
MKTIIVCTDFSTTATNAVQYAAALANAAKARLILFHHFAYPVPATDFTSAYPTIFVDELSADLERKLQDIKADLGKTYPIEIEYKLRSWDFSSDLEEAFHEEHVDLVVMGIHGQSAMVNVLFGSMTATAIRRGTLPLLVVPRAAAFHSIQKILFPCDDYPIPSAKTLEPLRNLANVFDAYIEIFTLFDLEKTPQLVPQPRLSPAKMNLEMLLSGTKHGYSFENEATVNKGILYEAARSSADIVAMIPHHHTFLSSILNPSETQRVAASISVPLLVMGEKVHQMAEAEA